MAIDLVVDLSFGDCGKARIVDYLTKDYDAIVRFSGSSNSGHSIVHNGKKYITRILPSGILSDKSLIIAQGVLLDLDVLLKEIEQFKEFNALNRLVISDKCHLLLPYHKQADAVNEKLTNSKIGSTKNGVAFCMQDKVGRRGIRVMDIFSDDYKNKIYASLKFWFSSGQTKDLFDSSVELIEKFKAICEGNIKDTSYHIMDLDNYQKDILAEAAQGTFLDIENGYYPYVTSTPCTAAGACLGMNIAPSRLKKVIGLTKAYVTRVGNGPFPTELFDDTAKLIQENGHEFGSVTGRARRVGWLNLRELNQAIQVNGVNELAITKMDVLCGIDPVKIMREDGAYTPMKGWGSMEDDSFRGYYTFIERETKRLVKYISYGADRDQMVIR